MSYRFDGIRFASVDEIEEVANRAASLIKKFGRVSKADILDIIDEPYGYSDTKLLWTDVSRWTYIPDGDGYLMCLPHPIAEDKTDMVNHPSHYKSATGLEAIDVIEAFTFDLKGIEATDTGNIIKYICRWKNKNGLQDLRKAQWYLNHLIAHVEKMEKENDRHE